jgi:hypothetical protein
MVREEITGTGSLVSRQIPLQRWLVFYFFEGQKQVVRGAVSRHYYRGVVRCEKGTTIPVGEYDLYAGNEAVLKVVNLGLGGWSILGL